MILIKSQRPKQNGLSERVANRQRILRFEKSVTPVRNARANLELVTEKSTEVRKSAFQEKMEGLGYELLMNEALCYDLRNPRYNPEKKAHEHDGMVFVWPPLSQGQIKQRYLNSGFSDVVVSGEAYDIYGNRIEDHVASVYVKREGEQK